MNKKIRFPPNCKTTIINNDYGDIVIKKPIVPTEFEIQLDLYLSLGAFCSDVDNGHYVKSEVTVYIDKKETCRFDLMIFRGETPVCAIEVKKSKYSNPVQSNKQKLKYNIFSIYTGVPVIYCMGENEIEETINQVKKIIN